jgi:hypothetical protein
MDQSEVERVAAAPLVELLEAIPADARLVWTEPGGLKATHYVPVGKYAHEAAALLRSLAKDAGRLELALATERGKLEQADAVADKWAKDADRLELALETERGKLSGLRPHAKWLRQAAQEIAREGHAGWGNTCSYAADAIDAAIDRAIEAAGRKEGGEG